MGFRKTVLLSPLNRGRGGGKKVQNDDLGAQSLKAVLVPWPQILGIFGPPENRKFGHSQRTTQARILCLGKGKRQNTLLSETPCVPASGNTALLPPMYNISNREMRVVWNTFNFFYPFKMQKNEYFRESGVNIERFASPFWIRVLLTTNVHR